MPACLSLLSQAFDGAQAGELYGIAGDGPEPLCDSLMR